MLEEASFEVAAICRAARTKKAAQGGLSLDTMLAVAYFRLGPPRLGSKS